MEEISKLIRKYQDGTATPEECRLVERFFMDTIDQRGVPENDAAKQEVLGELNRRYDLTPTRRGFFKRIPRPLKYVAAALLVFCVTSAWFFSDVFRDGLLNRIPESDVYSATDIGPGGHVATLSMTDGQTIELSDVRDGIVVGDGIKYQNGTAVVDAFPTKDRMFTLATPKGGTYQVTLSDGTRVWLNAQSQLQYPEVFDGVSRTVRLIGEAYFEVKRDENKPFFIHTDGQRIDVLGTSFNVSAYASDPDQKTTLVSGRLRVSNAAQATAIVLTPGEQSKKTSSGMLTKTAVNVTDVIAWKEGRFSFENKKFEQVMDELARWYDLDIQYEGTIPQLEFFGGIKRDNNLANVLSLLESSDVSYRMEPGRRLIIQHRASIKN